MTASKHALSKSAFIRGWQCHKALYLYKKRYYLRDKLTPEQLAKFKRGTNIGILARDLFPEGVDASPSTPFQYSKSVAYTQSLISQNTETIYEAAFIYHDVLAALDILTFQDGKWYGYEVKSSLAISETYLMDAALQYYVITGSGLKLDGIFIIYMNKDYVLDGEPKLNELFIQQNVTKDILKLQPFVEQEIKEQLAVIKLSKSPAIDIGTYCDYPYPCDFKGHCWKHVPQNSVFKLQWLDEIQKFDLYYKGILLPDNIPDDFITNPVQIRKLKAHKENIILTDKASLKEFLGKRNHPVCFLRVWYHKPALPLFDGLKPYEQLPFFISVGIPGEQDTEMEINHYLPEPDINPLIQFKQILSDIAAKCNCIVTFNDKEIRLIYDELIASEPEINPVSFIDLEDVLSLNYYYDPVFFGQSDILAIAAHYNSELAIEKVLSDAEAILEYNEAVANLPEADSFMNKMKKSSVQYLKAIRYFYNFLHDIIEAD
ncbi:MAG: DUF2779 domain-containing protein [Bacteroidales bacterium]